MPIAVPLISHPANTNNLTFSATTENGFITRQLPLQESEEEQDFSGEEFNSEEDSSDYSDDDELSESNGVSGSGAAAGLFEEYFDFEPNVLNQSSRTCNHSVTSRPCPFCTPGVSLRLANEVRIAFKARFDGKIMKSGYLPLDPAIIAGPFKAVKALHDLKYIKKVLDEIINLIVCVQNSADYKVNYCFSSAVMRIHDRTDSLLEDIRGSDKYDEFKILADFRDKLNSIGMVQGPCKENNINLQTFIECQR